ncbi:MAG: CHASE2 domain-containing protein [Muribaculaceae bacterium]|nr:CHASE2 domain-containing protein [Muribaculaceae bacterium]
MNQQDNSLKNDKKKSPNKLVVLIIVFFLTILLQVADYFLSNFTYPIFDSLNIIIIKDFITQKGDAPDKEFIYFNVGLDKELIPVKDEFGDTIGKTPITDRKLLTDFLTLLKDSDYKYIFLDIRFDDGTHSQNDSSLFKIMESLDRFSYSTHRDKEPLITSSLSRKGAYSDFRGYYRDGFIRYEFLQDGKESSALRMYSTLNGNNMSKKGPFYFNDSSLAYNMFFIPFYRNDTELLGENGLEKYHYLGYEMSKDSLLSDIVRDIKGKIVVIGDFENDKHTTYMGNVPGPLLTVRAYQMLEKTGAKFSWVCFGITSVIYMLILYVLFVNINLNDKICNIIRIKSRFFVYLISLIGWSLILGLVKIALYSWFHLAFTAWLPALVFSTVSYINSYRVYIEKEKEKEKEKKKEKLIQK